MVRWALFLFCISCFSALAQSQSFEKWNAPEYGEVNSGKEVPYLGKDEIEIIRLLNLARMNGPLFSSTYLKSYTDSTGKINKWTRTLQRDLSKLKPLAPLLPAMDLREEALIHAADMGGKGKVGHVTSSGKGPKARFKKLVKLYGIVGENCDYGNEKPLDIVMSLLIDEGVSSLGHRKNILSKKFYFIGVATRPHKKWVYSCVMDFGGKRRTD